MYVTYYWSASWTNGKILYCINKKPGKMNDFIHTHSLIPSSSLKSKLSSLRSKQPLLMLNTRWWGSWFLWTMFPSSVLSGSLHAAWGLGFMHTSSCRGLKPQQLWSRRLWIWRDKFPKSRGSDVWIQNKSLSIQPNTFQQASPTDVWAPQGWIGIQLSQRRRVTTLRLNHF